MLLALLCYWYIGALFLRWQPTFLEHMMGRTLVGVAGGIKRPLENSPEEKNHGGNRLQ
jgi:hypothetical protein